MKIIRGILAVIAGWIGGSFINLSLINLGHKVFPMEGIDTKDMKALAEVMPTMGANYFIFPFLAHALGTFVGAFLAGIIAANHKMKFALAIGVLFLIGGIIINIMITGPLWFTITDILVAYIPMAWLGGKLAVMVSSSTKKIQSS